MTVLLHASAGGYTSDGGWNPNSKTAVQTIQTTEGPDAEGDEDDQWSIRDYRQSLRDHTEDVCREMARLLSSLEAGGCGEFNDSLLTAARLHDWGKAHPVMQQTLHK